MISRGAFQHQPLCDSGELLHDASATAFLLTFVQSLCRKCCCHSSWRWHRYGPQWQEPHSRGEGNSWRWIVFFSGMSILSKNSDEANNMPTQWIVLISRGNCLWKSYLPQANTYAFCYCSITCFSVQAVMYWWSNCSYVEAEKWTDLSSMSLSTLKTWLQLLFQMKCLHLMPCTDISLCKLCGNVAVMFYNHRTPTYIDFAWACTQVQGGSLALSYWDWH